MSLDGLRESWKRVSRERRVESEGRAEFHLFSPRICDSTHCRHIHKIVGMNY